MGVRTSGRIGIVLAGEFDERCFGDDPLSLDSAEEGRD